MFARIGLCLRVMISGMALTAFGAGVAELRAEVIEGCPVDPPHLLGECFDCRNKCEAYWGPGAGWTCYSVGASDCCGCPQFE